MVAIRSAFLARIRRESDYLLRDWHFDTPLVGSDAPHAPARDSRGRGIGETGITRANQTTCACLALLSGVAAGKTGVITFIDIVNK